VNVTGDLIDLQTLQNPSRSIFPVTSTGLHNSSEEGSGIFVQDFRDQSCALADDDDIPVVLASGNPPGVSDPFWKDQGFFTQVYHNVPSY
jgi:hypothetical protein